MANILTWATDVLQAVDQSAAALSDSGNAEKRRDAYLSDSGAREIDGYGSGEGSDRAGGDATRWRTSISFPSPPLAWQGVSDAATPLVPPANKGRALASDGSLREGTPLLGDATAAAESEEVAGRTGILPPKGGSGGGLQQLARAPSPAVERARAARRALEGHRWRQPELKREFDEALRAVSEVEAKVSVLAAELERIERAALLTAAMSGRELESLRGDARAAEEALGSEQLALAATRAQLEERSQSLKAESLAYAKALATTRRHADDKRAEAVQLRERLQEMIDSESQLRATLDELRAAAPGGQVAASPDGPEPTSLGAAAAAEWPAEGGGEPPASPPAATAAEEVAPAGGAARDPAGDSVAKEQIQRLRQELSTWDVRLEAVELELAAHDHNAARFPSTAQREKELERRLRGLTEQLLSKQAQAEALASERAALQLRLDHAQAACRQLTAGGESAGRDDELKRDNSALGSRGSANFSGPASFPADPSDSTGKSRPRASGRGVPEAVFQAVHVLDGFSLRAGAALLRDSFLRSLVVAYVLALHLAIIVILSVAAAHRALARS